MAAPGLHCFMQAFSSCREFGGLLSSCYTRSPHCGGFSCCGTWALEHVGSEVAAHGPSCSRACGILPDWDQTCVPCLARQILNHWTTREATKIRFLIMSSRLCPSPRVIQGSRERGTHTLAPPCSGFLCRLNPERSLEFPPSSSSSCFQIWVLIFLSGPQFPQRG